MLGVGVKKKNSNFNVNESVVSFFQILICSNIHWPPMPEVYSAHVLVPFIVVLLLPIPVRERPVGVRLVAQLAARDEGVGQDGQENQDDYHHQTCHWDGHIEGYVVR